MVDSLPAHLSDCSFIGGRIAYRCLTQSLHPWTDLCVLGVALAEESAESSDFQLLAVQLERLIGSQMDVVVIENSPQMEPVTSEISSRMELRANGSVDGWSRFPRNSHKITPAVRTGLRSGATCLPAGPHPVQPAPCSTSRSPLADIPHATATDRLGREWMGFWFPR